VHAGSVAAIDDDFHAAGAEIIWVLEQGPVFEDGTAATCYDTMLTLGADQGWCVGDDETDAPYADAFDTSPFSVYRGFEIIVRRSTMTIEFASSHGSPYGNDNLTAQELLAEVEAVVAGP